MLLRQGSADFVDPTHERTDAFAFPGLSAFAGQLVTSDRQLSKRELLHKTHPINKELEKSEEGGFPDQVKSS